MARLIVPIELRWSDLDAYGHVNNVEYARILEEARIRAFWIRSDIRSPAYPTAIVSAGPQGDTSTLVAAQSIEYLRPMPLSASPVEIELWLGSLGGASLHLCYLIRGAVGSSGDPVVVFARATSAVVLVDPASGRPRRITPHERSVWQDYVEEPLQLRR